MTQMKKRSAIYRHRFHDQHRVKLIARGIQHLSIVSKLVALEATLGRAKTLMSSNRLAEAKELFEQIASNRAWRGQATAQSIYSLGQILVQRGTSEDLAQAQAHFQRVYISYKKYTPWVAKAYVSSGETFEKLGKVPEAIATYKEMIRYQDRFENYSELAKARERLRVLEQSVPATVGGVS